MKPSLHRHALMLLSLALATGPRCLAQADTSHTCAKAARILAKGHPEQKERWAYNAMLTCSGGSTALAAAWNDPPSDPESLWPLVVASTDMSDHRILEGAIRAFGNASISQRSRQMVLQAILSEVAPDRFLTEEFWADPVNTTVPSRADYSQRTGDVPITAADVGRARDFLASVSRSDADSAMRQATASIVAILKP